MSYTAWGSYKVALEYHFVSLMSYNLLLSFNASASIAPNS